MFYSGGWSTLKKLIYHRAFNASGGGTETTVTGVSPLLLAAALKKPIKSLTQYGLCSQADTPTPSAPVPIMCNNGALQMVDDELPAGYTRLQSIHFDGASYFDSGIVPNTYDYEIETKVAFDNSASAPLCAWGYMGSTSSLPRWLLASYSSGYLLNANTTAAMGVAFNTDPHVFKGAVFETNGTPYWASYIDGEQKQNVSMTSTASWEANTLSIYIGSRNNNGTAGSNNYFTGDLYYHKVTKNSVLIQHLIPCMDGNGTLGFYDLVTNTFFTNAGSGTFTAGAVDYSHAHLDVVGTDEVLMLNGANLADMNESNLDIGYYINNVGARTSGTSNFYTLGLIAVKPNTSYTIHTSASINYFNIMEYDSSKEFIKRTLWGSSGTPAGDTTTFTTEATTAFIRFGSNMDGTTATYAKISAITWMLTEGGTAESYEPYREQTASVVNLFAVGDYADTQEIISGAVKRRVVARRLTSDETGWALSKSGDTYRYRCRLDGAAYKSGRGTDVLCSHASAASSGSPVNSVFLNGSSNVEYLFFIPDQTIQTVDDFKEWLDANPVIVIYPLAEETTESVTPQPLHTNAGDNTISVTANVSPIELEAVYMKGA